MLAIGFDPSFIDTLVRAENIDGSLAKDLPSPGYHNRTPTITRIAGGNGVNLSAMLTSMDIEHTLVVPCDQEFEILLNKRNIKTIEKIQCGVNNSVGVTWLAGEIQFNDAKFGPGRAQWNQIIHNLWKDSPLHCYLNWGLNPNSIEWVSIQWLVSCGWSYQEIIEENDLFNQAIKTEYPRNSILLEPGSVQFHKDNIKLNPLLNHMAKSSQELEYAVFISNEEEYKEYSNIVMKQYILHTSEFVSLKQNDKTKRYKVPRLMKEPSTYVGAGDAFLAGIVKSLMNNILDPEVGILIAQDFLNGKL
ncbi:MAG: hypothetical protein HeimC2_29360 [Candidatus Heimdallarchaeota archaeon LC_2]|nr:MAG: hypothetical protein HeimC2_29360 [Candidatus Heimdallarchaeota archaeon LC_2]